MGELSNAASRRLLPRGVGRPPRARPNPGMLSAVREKGGGGDERERASLAGSRERTAICSGRPVAKDG